MYLISLSNATLFSCFTGGAYYLTSLLIELPEVTRQSRERYRHACKAAIFFNYSMAVCKILSLMLLSLDRFIAIVWPYFYKRNITRMRIICMLLFAWLQAIVTTIPLPLKEEWIQYRGNVGSPCGFNWLNSGYEFVVPFGMLDFVVPSVILIFTNVKVFLVARMQRRSIRRTIKSTGGGDKTQGKLSLVTTLAKAIALMEATEQSANGIDNYAAIRQPGGSKEHLGEKRVEPEMGENRADESHSNQTSIERGRRETRFNNAVHLVARRGRKERNYDIAKSDENGGAKTKVQTTDARSSAAGVLNTGEALTGMTYHDAQVIRSDFVNTMNREREKEHQSLKKIHIHVSDENSVVIDSCEVIVHFHSDKKTLCSSNETAQDLTTLISKTASARSCAENEHPEREIRDASDLAFEKLRTSGVSPVRGQGENRKEQRNLYRCKPDATRFSTASEQNNSSLELCDVTSIHSLDNDDFSRLPNSKRLKILSDPVSHREQMKHRDIRIIHPSMIISTLLLVLFFLVTWLPFVISRIVSTVEKIHVSPEMTAITSAITNLDVVMNPIVILGTRKAFRQVLLSRWQHLLTIGSTYRFQT